MLLLSSVALHWQQNERGEVMVPYQINSRAYFFSSLVFALQALKQFDMLKDGDRVLVCVSGGKDSLTLLHAMRQAQYVYRSQGLFVLAK